jgi:hypothetical protein
MVEVVFRIAGMRLVQRGTCGDRMVGAVAADGLRERSSAKVRRTETAAVGKSAAERRVAADPTAMAAASPTAPVRTPAPCGTGAAAAGSRCTCNGCTRCSERNDDEEN